MFYNVTENSRVLSVGDVAYHGMKHRFGWFKIQFSKLVQ